MKGLFIKDLYTLAKQMKIFLLMIVVFAVVPNGSMAGFAIVYSAMLPMTSLAYDERSHWDELAATMPYSDLQLVAEKYLLGWSAVAAALVLSLLSQFVVGSVSGNAPAGGDITSIVASALAAVTILALCLPFVFYFGVEKGRLVFLGVAVVVAVAIVGGGAQIGSWLGALDSAVLPLTACAVGVVALSAVSVAVSLRLRRRRAA